MIFYNVTIKIEREIEENWVTWMKEIHIPDVLKTGYFFSYNFNRLINGMDDGGVTYVIQYKAESTTKFLEYQRTAAPSLQKQHANKFKGKFVAFRTLMEEIDKG